MPTNSALSWKTWQKIAFRFSFLFLGLASVICWEIQSLIIYIFFFKEEGFNFGKIYGPLVRPLYWLDKNLFHTGYDPKVHSHSTQDNHFGVVFYLTLLLVAAIGCIAWSIADNKRPSYNKLYYWFRFYQRYLLAFIMLGYGLDKFIPTQMPYPNVISLLSPLGESSRFDVLWNFIGTSPGFERFTGCCEIIASLLLLNRRTAVFGSLFMCTILCNVVAFNVFYNIPVKMFSSQLLAYNLFLIVPFLKKLTRIFYYGQPVMLYEKNYAFETRWKKYLLTTMIIIIPIFIFVVSAGSSNKMFAQDKASEKRQRIYEVTSFIAKDTLPPLLTDTLRWKRFVFAYTNTAVIYSMKDVADFYTCDADSVKKTFALHDNPDTASWHVFHYEYHGKDKLMLTGKWKGNDVRILMKEIPIDSMQLIKEKISLITRN
jgi:hypothetical protein